MVNNYYYHYYYSHKTYSYSCIHAITIEVSSDRSNIWAFVSSFTAGSRSSSKAKRTTVTVTVGEAKLTASFSGFFTPESGKKSILWVVSPSSTSGNEGV